MLEDTCPHCDSKGWAFTYILDQTPHFHLLCDVHPLVEGHLLIIPKRHISCAGAYTIEEWTDFKKLYENAQHFIFKHFGSVATFEHGNIGQTVFHSHVHLLPFQGTCKDIVPETALTRLDTIEQIVTLFKQEGKYLFFSIDQQKWIVDTALGVPRFFRDRFAKALGCHERGDWKAIRKEHRLMEICAEENRRCQLSYQTSVKSR